MPEIIRIELVEGSPLQVEAAFHARNEIQMEHLYVAMSDSLEHLRDVWVGLAPIGPGHPGPTDKHPSWREREPGTYKESIRVTPITRDFQELTGVTGFGGTSIYRGARGRFVRGFESLGSGSTTLYGSVESTDNPVAAILEHGSGIYRGRGPIVPRNKKFMAIPGAHLAIGPSISKFPSRKNGLASATYEEARFVKYVKGQRPRKIMEQARAATDLLIQERFRRAARESAAEIKAMM